MTGATHQSPSVVFPNTTVMTTEASVRPPTDASVVTPSSLAKATRDNTGTAGLTGFVRRSSTGMGLRVGESDADLTATSEFMDATAGETAPISNSGDGLGIQEPGSMTRGGDIVANAPSGRACLHAKCPAVTGSLVPTSRMCASVTSATLDPSQPVSLAGSGVAAFCRSNLSEGEQDQASEQKAEARCGDCEVPLGRIDLVTHDAPLNSAPPIDADELIKAFGIPASHSACHFGTPSCSKVSVVADDAAARQPSLGTSLDLPAASSGVAGLSTEALVSELKARGFFVAEMKATTLRVAASSAIHSPVSNTSIPTT